MTQLNQSEMENMLKETFFCNYNHPSIRKLVENLAIDGKDPIKTTETIFKYVRDKIRFGADIAQVKASDTLEKGFGACWSKALLMVALLRYNKIPSRVAYNPVKREFMKPAMGEAYLDLPESIDHCFAQVYLDDKWVSVDPALDHKTYEKLFVPFNVSWGIDWDGTNANQLYTEHICGPVNFYTDIDKAFQSDVANFLPQKSEAIPLIDEINKTIWENVDSK